jgi:hypothetical protein
MEKGIKVPAFENSFPVLVGTRGDQRSETMESENDRENIFKGWNLYLLHR